MYRQSLDDYGLSLEQGTSKVPADGYFYVLLNGEIEGRFRSLKQAQKKFKELRMELGVKAVEALPPDPADIRRRELETMSNKALIWTDEDFNRVSRATSGKKGTRSAG